jgi:DNA-directed RNA polymerase specialized sigma24 family protein
VISGDNSDSFEAVYRAALSPAYRVAYRILGNVTDAEDAAAEGLARALASLAPSVTAIDRAWRDRKTAKQTRARWRAVKRPAGRQRQGANTAVSGSWNSRRSGD